MKAFFALGPGDIVADLCPSEGRRGETSLTFSRQLVDTLIAAGHDAVLVSRNARRAEARYGSIRLVNKPRRGEGLGGWRYHVSQLGYALELAWMARRFGADLAIVDSGTTHYFLLAVFRLLGIPVAVNFHNVRWPAGFPPRRLTDRLVAGLDTWFFRIVAAGGMGCSPECETQMRHGGATRPPYVGWTSQFSPDGFDPAPPTLGDGEPFRVLFVGRIERYKGVFDLLAIAERLRNQPGRTVLFDICGDGSDGAALRDAVAQTGLAGHVTLRGRLERAALLEAYRYSHAVIVPTRREFCEGMPLVCAEAVLSGRPLVTSRLSNALPVVGPAVLEVEPEDVDGYAAAIRRLAEDRGLYGRLQEACSGVAGQFTDPQRSYGAAVTALIARLGLV